MARETRYIQRAMDDILEIRVCHENLTTKTIGVNNKQIVQGNVVPSFLRFEVVQWSCQPCPLCNFSNLLEQEKWYRTSARCRMV